MKKFILIIFILIILSLLIGQFKKNNYFIPSKNIMTDTNEDPNNIVTQNPLTIESLRKGNFPGSNFIIEETLEPGSNYKRFIVSYVSEGHKIYGLLTIPNGEKPKNGLPAIIFNHGYIPPKEYITTERYVAYVDGFARNGYIVFKPDYRGHGKSEGEATGGYGSNAYTIDVLNALASIKKYKDVDSKRIGMWGHSMGGFITLRAMVVSKDIKAGVIWGGVVANYQDILYNWTRSTYTPPPLPSGARRWRSILIERYGTPEKNPVFWNSISANSYLKDISGPVELHHGTADDSVPVEFSIKLKKQLDEVNKKAEFFRYENDDHNITVNFNTAMNRSIAFFDKYVKGTQ